MDFYLAPMEGITGYTYRNAVHDIFGDVYARYFTPFISPRPKIGMQSKERKDVSPENNKGINLIPQILSSNPKDFISLANEIYEEFGWEEINLNAGCPAKTVVSHGRGSGMLRDTDTLDAFLDTIFGGCKMKISVKTRLGVTDEKEFDELLSIYEKYPIAELTIHARVMTDYYKLPARPDVVNGILDTCRLPVVYNGDIYNENDYERLIPDKSKIRAVMLGRGAITNPALPRVLKGGSPATPDEMRRFHDRLFEDFKELYFGDTPLLFHMKEMWSFMGDMYPDNPKALKAIRKSKHLADYKAAVSEILK